MKHEEACTGLAHKGGRPREKRLRAAVISGSALGPHEARERA
jgi:hypothetical protein